MRNGQMFYSTQHGSKCGLLHARGSLLAAVHLNRSSTICVTDSERMCSRLYVGIAPNRNRGQTK